MYIYNIYKTEMSIRLFVSNTFGGGKGGVGLPKETGRVERKEGGNGEGGISMINARVDIVFPSNAVSPS